ncbi:thioredoxin family protein [Pinibacter aurantiacus]|uniref:Thioredoxin family protein n=1 Tax=Pinibacter aurantiacus TaxID=2851599 RepID=A0A9E2S8F7_9BACT|nr:thioredoxin family protein [Pinibacter aurantiacus]MBV4355880.1 thioredoxin family protein [Pinibacter aurantiacus]
MKKIIIINILALVIGMTQAGAQGIQFSKMSFEDAKALAVKSGKNIFVDVMASWCGPCKLMEAKVFPVKEVGDYFNANFVCLKLDGEKDTAHGVFKKNKAGAYPTYMWLDNKGNLLDVQVGYMDAPVFLDRAKKALTSDVAKKEAAYEARWNAGERNPQMVNEYVFGILNKVHPEKVYSYVEQYAKGLSEEQLKSKETAMILSRFMSRPRDGFIFQTLLKYDTVYEKYVGYPLYSTNMYRIVVRAGNAALAQKDTAAFNAHFNVIKKAPLREKDMYMEIIDAEKDLNTKNYNEGLRKIIALGGKYGESHPYLFQQFCYSLVSSEFFKDAKISDDESKQVITIASKAFELVPTKETVLYLSAAYAKSGDYKKAYEVMTAITSYEDPKVPGGVVRDCLGVPMKITTPYGSSEEGKKMKELVKQKYFSAKDAG